MGQVVGFINFVVLAESNLFELLGPLLLFGIYAIATLARRLANSKQSESQEKKPSEPQQAVRSGYQAIHDMQVGKAAVTEKVRSPEQPQQYRIEPRPRTFEKNLLSQQRLERAVAYSAHVQKSIRSVRQKPRTEPYSDLKTQTVLTGPPQSIHIPELEKKSITEPLNTKDVKHPVLTMIYQPQDLRSAVILKEILDEPVSLRDAY